MQNQTKGEAAMNLMEQLKEMTVIVEDSGEIDFIRKHSPRDATTNPSLLLAAARKAEYRHIVEKVMADTDTASESSLNMALEKLAVRFGMEILKVVSGRVSVEVDARHSFDTDATMATARRIIQMFEAAGIDRNRILIKIAATWEGISAAEQLEKEGIHCNLTLLFSFVQAVACAEAGVTLISPFVGRIMDWYKAKRGVESIPAAEDPGVHSVVQIYNYYKKFGYQTEVMGASFRNIGEIIELAGCDLLTIAPALIEELKNTEGPLPRKLEASAAADVDIKKVTLDEKTFRWMLNEDAMATEKLAEGIRRFAADLNTLADYLKSEF
jgi:transaldolase